MTVTSVLALLLLLSACDAAGCKQETLERVTSTVLVQCIVRLAFSCSCSTSDGVYPPWLANRWLPLTWHQVQGRQLDSCRRICLISPSALKLLEWPQSTAAG